MTGGRPRAVRIFSAFCLAFGGLASGALAPDALAAQTPAPVTPILSLRVRAESWDWFDTGEAGRYAFFAAHARAGLSQERARLAWRLELAAPMLTGLPLDATLAPPAGALGLGANYAATNGGKRDAAGLFVKQAFVRFGRAGAAARSFAKVGRFEFSDAGEFAPPDPRLAALRQQRITQRLIGTFGFTHGQRSFDGAELMHRAPFGSFTATIMRPTTGVFDVDGAGSLPVDLVYAAWNRQAGPAGAPRDVRVFALQVEDRRGTTPTDSRPAPVRAAAPKHVGVTTFGGHLLQRATFGAVDADLLVWGARQTGRWGGLAHRAGALSVEGGVRVARAWGSPSLRAGVNRSTGDADPTDATHTTFFQALPTPRAYAPFPFYNLQNDREAFVTLEATPKANVVVRLGARSLHLAEQADLWYVGGGAYDRRTFGYAGRPSGGNTSLGSSVDLSIDWRISSHLAISGYAAKASGGPVTDAIYGSRSRGAFGFLEATLRR